MPGGELVQQDIFRSFMFVNTNKPSGSMKCRGYIDRLGDCHLSIFETLRAVSMKVQDSWMLLGKY
jgi:hypothetical protein